MVKAGTMALILLVIIVIVVFQFLGIWERTFSSFERGEPKKRYNPRNDTIQTEMTYLTDRAHENLGVIFESGGEFEFGENTFYDNTIAVGTGITDVEFYCEKERFCEGYYGRLEIMQDFSAKIKVCCTRDDICRVGIGNVDIPCEA